MRKDSALSFFNSQMIPVQEQQQIEFCFDCLYYNQSFLSNYHSCYITVAKIQGKPTHAWLTWPASLKFVSDGYTNIY